MGARGRGRSEPRGDRESGAEAAGRAQDRRQSIARLDIPGKVTGGAAYVQDIRLPGMVHGRVVRPPRYGAKLESFDEAKVKALPGVIAVVRDGSFLGVVAEREEQAIKAAYGVRRMRQVVGRCRPAGFLEALRTSADDAVESK